MPRTKIVCTIGPASAKPSVLLGMMKNGMAVARLNFSHGTHKSHAAVMHLVRSTAKKLGEEVAILGDLQGPKIRLGVLPEAGVRWKAGETVSFSTAISFFKPGGPLPVTYKGLHKDVKKGDRILVDDGLLETRVLGVSGKTIRTKVVYGGVVTSHKGMYFPDTSLAVSPITAKDRDDLAFGVKAGVDWIALSFVTDPRQVRDLRKLILKATPKGKIPPRVIVKIEKHEAVKRFAEILAETDAVMVARGDLGVEIPAAEVPERQKEIVAACREAGKPVVVATQMLDSMIRNPRPTRAEVSDVANAVFDHVDAVMLSGESATGKYPLETVKTMRAIVEQAEASKYDDVMPTPENGSPAARALAELVEAGQLDGIVSSIELVQGAEQLNHRHPEIPLHLAAPNETLARQANLRWGIRPFVLKAARKTFAAEAVARLKKEKRVKKGMRLAVVLGSADAADCQVIAVR
jgi:pyruvate kinase